MSNGRRARGRSGLPTEAVIPIKSQTCQVSQFRLEVRVPTHPITAWHQLVNDRNPSVLDGLLDNEAVFVSPIVHTPQRGKKLAFAYLAAAFQVFLNPTFRYVREIIGASDAMLEFETELDGVLVNGVDIITWNDSGRIVEFKVMIRPLKAISLIHQRMAVVLQARP